MTKECVLDQWEKKEELGSRKGCIRAGERSGVQAQAMMLGRSGAGNSTAGGGQGHILRMLCLCDRGDGHSTLTQKHSMLGNRMMLLTHISVPREELYFPRTNREKKTG